MFVKSIEYASPENIGLTDPTWETVMVYLKSLDGDTKDGVILGSTGDSYMGISGGEANRFIVAGYLDGLGSFILACGQKDKGEQSVVVSGDYNVYPSENVISLEDAMVAAKEFFNHGVWSERFPWSIKRWTPPKPQKTD